MSEPTAARPRSACWRSRVSVPGRWATSPFGRWATPTSSRPGTSGCSLRRPGSVWRELGSIPFGTTISYGEQARRIGRPQAARAVGAANGRNPVPVVLPCHRVIGSGGALTGFGGGLDTKRTLLRHEEEIVAGRG